ATVDASLVLGQVANSDNGVLAVGDLSNSVLGQLDGVLGLHLLSLGADGNGGQLLLLGDLGDGLLGQLDGIPGVSVLTGGVLGSVLGGVDSDGGILVLGVLTTGLID